MKFKTFKACLLLALLASFAELDAQTVVPVVNVIVLSSTGQVQNVSKVTSGEVAQSVILKDVGTARLEPNSELRVPDSTETETSLHLLKGRLFFNINAEDLKKRAGGEFRLKTPAALLAVKGTEFFVDVGEGGDTVGVHQGSVLVQNSATQASALLQTGQAIKVSPNIAAAPRPLNNVERGYPERYPAPAADASVIQGRVVAPNGRPYVSVEVLLFDRGRAAQEVTLPSAHTTTDRFGRFAFGRAGKGPKYSISALRLGALTSKSEYLTVNDGPTPEIDLLAYQAQIVEIRFALQTNGSRNFTGASVKKGRMALTERDQFAFFSEAKAGPTVMKQPRGTLYPDLGLTHSNGICGFSYLHSNKNLGIYDAGTIPFDQITVAEEKGYDDSKVPCVVGHVYIARTYEGKYAKLTVVSMKDDKS